MGKITPISEGVKMEDPALIDEIAHMDVTERGLIADLQDTKIALAYTLNCVGMLARKMQEAGLEDAAGHCLHDCGKNWCPSYLRGLEEGENAG
jgi:hypothetical protein